MDDPTTTATEGFGLMFYNARWYDVYLNHFTQPDTIVPDPGNSQDWDRYAYARNNPVRYSDPSGHAPCFEDGYCVNGKYSEEGHLNYLAHQYHIKFTGNWSNTHKWAVLWAVQTVGDAFARDGGTSTNAFRDAYGLDNGKMFKFEWDENCWGCRADPIGCDAGTTTGAACDSAFGYTNGENWIEFASMSEVDTPLRWINNVIHELGHAFNIRLGRTPENALSLRADLLVRDEGFYGAAGNITWQQSRSVAPSEIFADQFLGWTYGRWGNDFRGPLRTDFMNQMNGSNGWVAQAAGLP